MNVRQTVLRFWLSSALVVLAWLGIGEVRAQSVPDCNWDPTNTTCTREEAYSACLYQLEALAGAPVPRAGIACNLTSASSGRQRYTCSIHGNWCTGAPLGSYNYFWNGNGCPAGQIWNDLAGQKRCMPSCTSRGEPIFTPGSGAMIPNGSVGCSDGCEYMTSSNGDGTYTRFFIGDSAINHCSVIPNNCSNSGVGYTMNYGLNMCVPPVAECAPNEVKDPLTGMCTQGCPAGMVMNASGLCEPDALQCPAGMIRSPEGNCLPGAGQCYSTEVLKPDGTCGLDSDGDGVPDEFDPDTDSTSFTGGDTCDAPPSCSGDAIMCGQSRIQWRIECNTRKDVTVSGGGCDSVPVCSGRNCDALEYSQLLQQWRTSCALQGLAAGQGGLPGGGEGQPAWTQVSGDGTDGVGQEPDESEYKRTLTLGVHLLDQTGLGLGGSGVCPTFEVIDLGMFGEFDPDQYGWFCQFIQLAGAVIVFVAGFIALRLLFGG